MAKLAALVLASLLVNSVVATTGIAQSYPSQPIRFIVPYAPGGSNDVLGRVVGQSMSAALGQPVLIENRAGGATLIGASAVASSPPDGYTLLFTSSLALNELLSTTGPRTRDFAPIIAMATLPLLVVVHPSIPSDIKSFIAFGKSNPNKISYATFGKGTLPHLACAMFGEAVGVQMVDVPYRGGAQSVPDAVKGEIQLVCDTMLTLPFIRDGKLKAIAVMSRERSSIAPDIPTLTELGYPDTLASISIGLYAPAGTPRDVIVRLNQEANKALHDPAVARVMTALGGEAGGGTPEKLAAMLAEDGARYGKVIKALGLPDKN
jgi:tripartite-type tricarboxylate transporter receptor subunit TctC